MTFEKIAIQELIPAEYNPRKQLKSGDEEYEKIKNSITEFGFVEPIIVNADKTIIGGHQRFSVLKDLGYTEVECVVVDVDKTKEKALNVALNKISGEWNFELLSKLLDELQQENYDIEFTGFDLSEAEKLWDEYLEQGEGDNSKDDEYEIELPENPVSKKGDIWLLGKHRVMCGDSTSLEDVKQLVGDAEIKLICTDPPYNVDYGATQHPSWRKRSILNDAMSTDDFHDFLFKAFSNVAAVGVKGAMLYSFMSAQEWGNMMDVLSDCGFHWSSTIIWNKDRLVLSRKDFHTKYEPIFYGWLDNAPRIHQLEDRTQSDVWDFQRPSKSDLHPTMKPVELIQKMITNSSYRGECVLDLFGGSGTTLIACENTNRKAHLMELDPKYVDVIVNRYKDKIGSEEVYLLRNGEKIAYAELS
jgi:DNA modification methylase